jgi:hypothetical protein
MVRKLISETRPLILMDCGNEEKIMDAGNHLMCSKHNKNHTSFILAYKNNKKVNTSL